MFCLQFSFVLFNFVISLITTMNSRLLQFLNAENITQAQFADSIGVTRASISHIISGRNKPSYEFISVMMRKYPQLNPEWLILGKGRMYNDRPAQQTADISGEDLLFPTDFDSLGPALQETHQQMTPVPSRMNTGNIPDSQATATAVQKEEYQASNPSPAAAGATIGSPAPTSAMNTMSRPRSVSKIIVFFDDGTFQEMRG